MYNCDMKFLNWDFMLCEYIAYYESKWPLRGKTNNVVSEQVRHKLACAVTEAG